MSLADAGSLILSILMASAAGLVGCFALMRRMTLAADAISHVALPGIGLALALQLPPLFGALAMLFVGAFLIWGLQSKTRLPTETVVGVVFSAALALGSMITSGEELIDALLGQPGTLPVWEAGLACIATAAVIAFVLTQKGTMVLSLLSRDVAQAAGVKVARLDLLYLLGFALTVALGLRFLGVLLMGALIIIPAATARRLARGLDQMLALAVAFAVVSTVAGIYVGKWFDVQTGPPIVVIAAALFLLSLLVPPRAT